MSLWKGPSRYPDDCLGHPSEAYPEYPFREISSVENVAYDALRMSLKFLGLDQEHYGSRQWNPLGPIVKPGDRVLIKPNWIREGHAVRADEWEQVITHPSIIRGILDYVYIALHGQGQVVIADGPQTDSDYDEILRRTSVMHLISLFQEKGLSVSVLDLRREHWVQKGGITCARHVLQGDPLGHTTVDLHAASEFQEYSLSGRFYGADYDARETVRYHSQGRHCYVLCRTALEADVIINLPKMKTHKKTGITLSLKNMVGVNGHRNCLPHYTVGTPAQGGDEFPDDRRGSRVQSAGIAGLKRCLTVAGGRGGPFIRSILRLGRVAFGDTSRVIRSGNWYGNDTLWRAVLDLNKVLFYFDGSGKERPWPRRYLTIVDGIVAGEGDGPSSPSKKAAGVILAGLNPVAVDTVCATIMGFDFESIPLLDRSWHIARYPLVQFKPDDVVCQSNVVQWCGPLTHLKNASHLGFRPHFGWVGHIERDSLHGTVKQVVNR